VRFPAGFGPFRVLHQIGAGTLGPVFLAHDPARDRPVAVKLFALDLPSERIQQLIVEFERLIAAELYHPALNTPLATGIADGSAYLVYEYVDAQSLDLAVREFGPAPPAHAVRVCAQLAGALDFAVAVNVVHGALHPRDVLLSATDIRLTGAGISRALEAVGVEPPVRRPYTAPERIEGAEWDRRADVFSLATLVHELLWGRRISGLGSEAATTLTPIAGGDLPRLRAAFARALAQNAPDRFSTALGFAEALSEALPDLATEALPPPVAAEPAVAGRRASDVAAAAAPLLPLDEAAVPAERDHVAGPPPSPPEPPAIAPVASSATTAAPADPADLQLIAAEEERYRDVETAPSIVEPVVETSSPLPAHSPIVEPMRVERRERRSVGLPIAAALAIGLGLGFFGGYGARSRTGEAPAAETPAAETRQPAPTAVAPAATQPAPSAATPREPGREFTETAVAPAAPPLASPPAPPASSAGATPPAQPNTRGDEPTAGPGRILVRSTPAGARVVVDGREYGPTPVAVRDLAAGTHRVRVTHDGYATVERRVSISASRPAQSLTIPLQRSGAAPEVAESTRPVTTGGVERFVGTLVVDSRPTGAKVFLDGRAVGSTPLSMREVRAGEHAVRLEHDGYRRWSGSVRVVAAEQNRVTASLER
jgi:serine/threonine-protein kinase